MKDFILSNSLVGAVSVILTMINHIINISMPDIIIWIPFLAMDIGWLLSAISKYIEN